MIYDNYYLLFNKWQTYSNDIALIDADNNITADYCGLFFDIQDLVYNLNYHDKNKKLIFCFCDNSIHTVIFYLASLHSNNAIALFDRNLKKEQKEELIKLYEPDIVFGANELDGYYQRINCDFDSFIDISYIYDEYKWLNKKEIHKDLSLLLSTSGSTGSPKLVRLSKKNIISNAKSISEALEINREDIAITSLPIHYSYGLSVLNSHLNSNATIVLTNDGILSSTFWEKFKKNQCTSFAGVPYSYSILKKLDLNKLKVDSLKVMTQAGGKLDDDSIKYFNDFMKDKNGRFYVMYGQTEATARIAILPSKDLDNKIGCAGKVIPNGKIEIINNEVVYSGDNVMLGYAESYLDLDKGDELNGVLFTGDLGCLDYEGFLKITGRSKRICKILGMRINLDELQSFLSTNGPTAVFEKDGIIRIFCEYDFDNLLDIVYSKYNINKRCVKLYKIETLPQNQNKKIDYKALELLC